MMNRESSSEIVERIIIGARWSTALRLCAQIVSWVTTIFVVRFISPEDYGLNAMLEAPWGVLLLVSTLGIDLALTRAGVLTSEQLSAAFGWLLLINFAIFVVYYFGAPLIAAYFNEPSLESMSKALAFTFLLIPFRVIPNSLLARDFNFKLISSAELVASVIAALSTLLLAVLGAGVWALVSGVLIGRFLVTVILSVWRPWICRPSLAIAPVKGLLTFGGLASIWAGLSMLIEKFPSFVAGPYLGSDLLGLFAVAVHFATLPIGKIMPILNPIIFPAFSKFGDSAEDAVIYTKKTLRLLSFLFVPVAFGISAVADSFVPVVLGDKWADLVLPLVILSAAMPLRFFVYILRPIANALHGADLPIRSTLFAAFITCASIALYGRFGVVELALSVIFADAAVLLYTTYIFGKKFQITLIEIGKSLAPGFVCSAMMYIVLAAAEGLAGGISNYLRLFVEAAVGVGIYVLAMRFLYSDDFRGLIRMLFGRMKR